MKAITVGLIISLFLSCVNSSTHLKQGRDSSVEKSNSSGEQNIDTLKINKMDSSFQNYWNEFTSALIQDNPAKLKPLIFDSVMVEGKLTDIKTFMHDNYEEKFDTTLRAALLNAENLDFSKNDIDPKFLPGIFRLQMRGDSEFEIVVNIATKSSYPPTIKVLKFLRTAKGYRFYAYDRFGE